MAVERDDEARALLQCLGHQRATVLSIVEDLDEQAWHTSVVHVRLDGSRARRALGRR